MAAHKKYVLGMFPYPSGDGLHVGHVRIYTAVDVMSRYFRMRGDQVLDPTGWDAFGLPAENAAIKKKTIPQKIVPQNYNNFRNQMKNLQFEFDWEREFATTDPTYYGLTQWIFLELYKKGLVYREQVPINWCPKCKTGLANEEVLPDGTHERCGTPTGKKMLPQWVMKITEYADRLLNDLDHSECTQATNKQMCTNETHKTLDWPRGILEMQRNWIGKKEGLITSHKVVDMDMKIETFSAFPAWLYADTFIAIAPDHPLVVELVKGTKFEKEVLEFVKECEEITDADRLADKFEKKGVFTGRYFEDPINLGQKMPVWIANFAMMGFGTGVIRCSGHDPRDWEFAQKYDIEIHEVVDRTEKDHPVSAHDNAGVLKNSGPFDGREINQELISEMVEHFVKEGHSKRHVNWHLRDWVFSRQRYWGEPIPLVYCKKCGDEHGVVPLSEKDLPLILPELDNYEPTDTGESPLSRVKDWVNTQCPSCGGPATRETDTMPNWAGSCWYHLAFAFWNNSANQSVSKSDNQKDTKTVLDEYRNSKSETPYSDFWREVAKPAIDKWLPVDWYLGGAEHAVLHLLYARFWSKVLQDLGHLDFSEPYLRLRSVGIVLAEDGRKMSKSWGNVINPDDVVKEFGSDAVRLYEMFMGPWNQSIAWDSRALVGMKRLCERIEKVAGEKGKIGDESSPILADKLAKLVGQVEKGILEQKFNTAIAGIMEFLNLWKNSDLVISQKHAQNFAQILSPFAPTTAQKVYEKVGGEGKAEESEWPTVSAEEVEVPVTIAVQVNGKLRATLSMPKSVSINEETVVKLAMEDERIKKWLPSTSSGQVGEVKKKIFVPGRLVNIVV